MLEVECLDANVVQDLMSGALDEAVRGAVLGHLDTCEDCRELLGVTARVELADHLARTQPYSDKLVRPRTPVAQALVVDDIGLDATVAPPGGVPLPLTDTIDSTGHAATMRPPARIAPPRNRTPTAAGPFGRYILDEKLGAGAMGVVWRAHDPKLGRKVALKLLRQYDPALLDRLVREAQAMAQVSHPNVVGVFDVGATEGSAFIAMELVNGESLRTWQAGASRTLPEIVTAYVAAGRGLSAAHGAGIVHRDFKADNVLVADDGRIRVTDFGLAAARPSESGTQHSIADVNLTAEGSVLGTPAYMAPEQFASGNIDPRTDQFNFCAALYEALYGARAFGGTTYDELSDNVINGRFDPAPSGTHVSNGLRAILLRGLQPKPGDRFPTMDHLLVELGHDRARPWRRTSWIAIAVTAALGVGLVADWTVRDRLTARINESFRLTGSQVDHTVQRMERTFALMSEFARKVPALFEVAGHRDQADFGLGSPAADREDLEKLHDTLVSMQWPKLDTSQRAVIDYKSRLLFTSYAPQIWNTDMNDVPEVKRALDSGQGSSLVITSYSDPVYARSQVFGSAAPHGLFVMQLGTLALGNASTKSNEARAIVMQFADISVMFGELRLDDQTLLAVVAPNNTIVADPGFDDELVRAAPRNGVAHVQYGGHDYQVLQFPVTEKSIGSPEGIEIAQVVMARRVDGVLTLFPHARVVFVLAAFGALGLAIGTAIQARKITGARVA